MDEKNPYRTTALAGYFVAGRKIPSSRDEDGNIVPKIGHVLMLTEAEARSELREGTIEAGGAIDVPPPLAPPPKPSKPVEKPAKE